MTAAKPRQAPAFAPSPAGPALRRAPIGPILRWPPRATIKYGLVAGLDGGSVRFKLVDLDYLD